MSSIGQDSTLLLVAAPRVRNVGLAGRQGCRPLPETQGGWRSLVRTNQHATEKEKAVVKKMAYKLIAVMVLGMLTAFALGGTVAIAQESHFSELWGRTGERWTSRSRLPDFSYAGYHAGERPIPSVKPALNVRNLDAKGDGTTDDTRAFKEAIARADGGGIFIPPGRYVISDVLPIKKSHVILQGAGQGATTLYFARCFEDILGVGKAPYWGGMIEVSGGNRGKPLTTITSDALRGDTALQVASARDIRAGQWVRLRMTNPADNSLGSHLYADKGTLNAERRRWFAGHIVDWAVRVRSVQDNTVTLERPLRLDVPSQWQPELWRHRPTVEEVGVENLTIEFPPVEYRGHYKEAGYFAIQFDGVYHSWVRNVTILDADIGVVLGAGGYNTVANVTLKAQARTGAATNGETGHYGLGAGGISQDNLFTHCALQTIFVHNLSVGAFANGNVFSVITTRTGRFDHHGAAPYENLYTDILILQNAGDLFSCGGNRADEPNSGARTTLWNIRSANNSFPRYFHTAKFPQINIVGIEAWATQKTQTDAWIESWPGQTTRPPNLYEAQLTRRLASLGKKMHGSKPTARSGGQRLDP